MRTRTLAALVLNVLIVAATAALTSQVACAQFFRDDFEDGSAIDGNPVTWVPEVPPWPVGEQRVEAGSLILTPARDDYPNPDFYETDWEVEEDFPTDVVLRTRVRTLGASGVGYHGIFARDTTSVDVRQGVYTSAILATSGYLTLLVGQNLNNTFLSEATFSDLTTRTHDINLELWLSGRDISVFAWRDGTPRPTSPRLTALSPLQNVTTGRVGLGFGQEDDIPTISGAFRYFEVASVSTSIAGDFNNDDMVDAADYVVWRNGLGSMYVQSDYDVWRAHFGQPAAIGSATLADASIAGVPEPCTLLVPISGLLPLVARRRHKRRAHGKFVIERAESALLGRLDAVPMRRPN